MFESGMKPTIPSHIVEERQDVIFRKVRGILNKITPETFDKLSKELVNVGLDSPRTLRGVIYLLFDKALKDLKYSSLYAKLCQELSEKAPNFEQQPGPNTFCKFLISKCEDEFERRRKANEDFDNKKELTDEEYELKAIAKQKMLGNIKFICELGKKRLLQEEILHECIRGLLSKKKERPIQDQAQDLECLCQIMRTIGSLLDIQASRNLMNQYFDRVDMFSKKVELPSRIRFMLRDVIDLRNNNWRPRPFQREDNVPQPLSKLRQEAGYDPNASSAIDKFGNNRNLNNDLTNLHGNKMSLLLDDGPSFTTSTDIHWGPSFLEMDQHYDPFSSGIKHSTSATVTTTNSTLSTAQKPALFQQRENRDPFSEALDYKNHQQLPQQHHLPTKISAEGKRIIEPGGPAFERRPFSDPNIVGMVKERDSSLSGIGNKPPQMGHVHSRAQQRNEERPMGSQPFQQQRNFSDSRQSRDPIRSFNPPPPVRGSTRHQSHDIIQQQQQQIPPPFNHHGYGREMKNYTSESRDESYRERRPNRYSGPTEFAGPRFRPVNNNQSINYRHNRPPNQREQQHHFERSNQPESELNLNWRASGQQGLKTTGANTSDPSGDNTNRQPTYFSNEPFVESRPVKPVYVPPTSRMNEPSRKQPEPYVDERKRSSLTEKNSPQTIMERESIVAPKFQLNTNTSKSQIVQQQQIESNLAPRLVESRHNQVQNRMNNSPIRQQAPPYRRPPPQEVLQTTKSHGQTQLSMPEQPHHPHRHNIRQHVQTDNSNKGVQHPPQRKINPPSTENDYPKSRFFDAILPEERGFFGTNDSDKIANRRRGFNLSGMNTNTKDHNHQPQQPQQQNQTQQHPVVTLPKPPPKVIDGNFSLRPSHNLVGRASSSMKPVQSSTTAQNDPPPIGVAKMFEAQVDQTPKSNPKSTSNINEEKTVVAAPVALSKINLESNVEVGTLSKESPTRAAARDFHVNKFISVLGDFSSETTPSFSNIATKVKELKIPRSYQHECLANSLTRVIPKSENDRENMSRLLAQIVPSVFEPCSLLSAFKLIFENMPGLEVETPKVKSLVASFLSQSVMDCLLNLEDVGSVLSGGRHHPLFLLFLQKLEKSGGQAWLNEKFMASKLNLMDMLPEADRSKERLASILKDRCLGFLDPMLTIEPDLWEQMKERDASPAAVYRWIKENVDITIQATPLFAHVLVSCLMRYIHNVAKEKSKTISVDQKDETSNQPESSKSSPSSSQTTSDLEKDLLAKYQQVLQAILNDKQLQLATLYALQSFYHGLDFPKGALLRWFHMLYDMNIVDDDVFFIWKEEINDDVPGKGQALFQVNTWLNWLAEAESEEEEEV